MDRQWQVADTLDYELLKSNAAVNRRNMTEAESVFWSFAKASGLGEKCRRQYVIGPYIVDFFFRTSMLIVEIDGGYHFTDAQQADDRLRQKWLENQGYTILRFTNEQVLFDTENIKLIVKQNLRNLLSVNREF